MEVNALIGGPFYVVILAVSLSLYFVGQCSPIVAITESSKIVIKKTVDMSEVNFLYGVGYS